MEGTADTLGVTPPPGRDLSPLGRALILARIIDEPTLRSALAEQSAARVPLIPFLLSRSLVDEVELARFMASRLGLEFVDFEKVPVDQAATQLIPVQMERKYRILPIALRDDKIVLAMADPTDVVALDDVRALTRREVIVVTCAWSLLNRALERTQRISEEALDVTAKAADEAAGESAIDDLVAAEIVDDAPIIKLVNMTISQAAMDRASDIHIEPYPSDLRIRFRIDGVLHEVTRVPKSLQSGIVTRLKLMANLNIAERRVPQDGRISLRVDGKEMDLRLATLPTVEGEKIVIRILDKTRAQLSLGELGFLSESLVVYEKSFRRPWGTILVTGPTGSGKSTTLYATINILNSDDRNIITVEDPVEYRLPGVNQVQVHAKAGLGFANALRSILRSDPDVILVGEIRDRETATIAVEAALTGHLVLSSIHTNDAASTPSRLFEMGVEPYLIASALDCVVAQRLARRLCDNCKVELPVKENELVLAGWNFERVATPKNLFRPRGCLQCSNTGYQGRIALHEVMPITNEMERAIADSSQTDVIRKLALDGGMVDMRTIGMLHVANGMTSLEEVLRVVA
ncbi:MAG: GspE/PulE family protein [Acidimicrobiales bacterium]